MKKELEIWKPIEEFLGLYEASNLGKIRTIRRWAAKNPKIMTQYNPKGRYQEVHFWKEGSTTIRSVHRLVALAFIPNPENKPQINHIDGNKLNNCVDNLEWCTNSENQRHAYKLGLKSNKGDKNPNSKLSSKEIENIIKLYNSGISIREISIITNNPISRIRCVFYNSSWKEHFSTINKRDERQIVSKEKIKNIAITKFNNKVKCANIIITSINLITLEETTFQSIKKASDITGIPRKTIEYALKHGSINRNLSWKISEITNLNEVYV